MKKQLIIFFFLAPLFTLAQFGRWANDLSFYWGSTYRLNTNFYNSFNVSYEKYRSSCTHASYKGLGAQFDNFNNGNYSLSIKYFRSLLRRPDLFMIPYWSVSPVMFSMTKQIGLNLKPELGLRFNTGAFTRRQPISLSLNISYGYDIPIIKEKEFFVGRHDFSAKIALTFNLNDIRYYLRENKTKDTEPEQAQEKKNGEL